MAARTTRLIRAAGLRAVQQAVAVLVAGHDLDGVRACAVLVPSRAAGLYLRRTLEDRCFRAGPTDVDRAMTLPELLTRDEWYRRMHERLRVCEPRLSSIEREILLSAAAREAVAAGEAPPFRLRPGLVGEMLAFYDGLCRQRRTLEAFDRLILGDLEPRAEFDRGAARLLRQTRFLSATFRAFERRLDASGGLDEHLLRRRLLEPGNAAAFRHVIVAVGDVVSEPSGGLFAADFDLLMRQPGLESIDIVATHEQLGAGLSERLHEQLPGLDEADSSSLAVPDTGGTPLDASVTMPRLVVPGDAGLAFTARDREEELRLIARQIKALARRAPGPTDRVAVVFRRPLPYVYLARTVFQAAGIECQVADALPLAAEPFAAALDLVFAVVESGFARPALAELLRSPHFAFGGATDSPAPPDVAAFDRGLADAGYLGDPASLARLAEQWDGTGAAAARASREVADALAPVAAPARLSVHVGVLLEFLRAHARDGAAGDLAVSGDDEVRPRHLRARGGVLSGLRVLRAAALTHDDPVLRFADVAAILRRWIEAQTFTPLRGTGGVHVVDLRSAAFGEFDRVFLVGLAEGDWPEPASRNIFYPAFLLGQLGWPQDQGRYAASRAAFLDALSLARDRVSVSTFALEDDSIVNPSPLLDDLAQTGLALDPIAAPTVRIFADEALTGACVDLSPLGDEAAAWARVRLQRSDRTAAAFHGSAGPTRMAVHTVTAIDRYLECPFKYFAASVLRLDEDAADESATAARSRGRFVHEVLRAFFETWQARGGREITPQVLEDARGVFADVVARHVATLPPVDGRFERLRLLGSPAAAGVGEVVLAAEAGRPSPVRERLLEYAFDGEFTLAPGPSARLVRLRGTIDRVDVLADGRLRVVDYKTGKAPDPTRSVQLPIYLVCAQQHLGRTRGVSVEPGEASYVAFGDEKPVRVVVEDGPGGAEALAAGAARLVGAIDSIERGAFPPRPAGTWLCASCGFAAVCRKDYVGAD
jgi:putative RecB family exonuclease